MKFIRNKAVFIDRDGTINKNIGYIDNPDKFHMYPQIADGIKLLNDSNFMIILITNQSGISRSLFTEDDLNKIHDKMKDELKKGGAKIDKIYFCPHHPNDKCNCRKPNTGMFQKAIPDNNIDTSISFLIGDRMLDIEAGNKMGLRTILVPENKELIKKEMAESKDKPDYYCNNFLSAVEWILKQGHSPI